MDAGRALRAARRRKGLTQRALAEQTGVPQSTIGRIESGAVMPRVDTLDGLLKACDENLEAMPLLGVGVDRSLIATCWRCHLTKDSSTPKQPPKASPN